MEFYDVAEMNVNNDLSSRLGYTKIFGPGDIIEIGDKQKRSDSVWIFRGNNMGEISRAIKGRAIGIVMDSFTVEKSIIEEAAGYGKIICIDAGGLCKGERPQIRKKTIAAKRIFLYAMKARAEISLVTLAKQKEGLLSSMQLLALSSLLGADPERGRRMASALGRFL